MPIYFEDIGLGDVAECGSFSLGSEEIIAFARRYDPRPWHIDLAEAERSAFGRLVASSLHVHLEGAALVTEWLTPFKITAGLGWQPAQFHAPVYPDVTYRVAACWSALRPSHSRPGFGVAGLSWRILAPDDAQVMSFGFNMLIQSRPRS